MVQVIYRYSLFILQVKPLIWVESVIERHAHSRVEYMIKVLDLPTFIGFYIFIQDTVKVKGNEKKMLMLPEILHKIESDL